MSDYDQAPRQLAIQTPLGPDTLLLEGMDGCETGFNELTMEDQTGVERMHLHAQYDHTVKIGNNHTARVDQHQVRSRSAAAAALKWAATRSTRSAGR